MEQDTGKLKHSLDFQLQKIKHLKGLPGIFRSCHWQLPYYWARKLGQIHFILTHKRILLTEIRHDITMTIPTESVTSHTPPLSLLNVPFKYEIPPILGQSHRTARGTFNPICTGKCRRQSQVKVFSYMHFMRKIWKSWSRKKGGI